MIDIYGRTIPHVFQEAVDFELIAEAATDYALIREPYTFELVSIILNPEEFKPSSNPQSSFTSLILRSSRLTWKPCHK